MDIPRNAPKVAHLVAPISCGFLLLIAVTMSWQTVVPEICAATVTEAWARRYSGSAHRDDKARAVAVDSDGNAIVTGVASYVSTNYQGWEGDFYTAKYAATNGTLLWEKRYNSPADSYDEGRAVAVDQKGDVLVAGVSFNGITNADYYTAKYSGTDGALIWERRYDSPTHGRDIAIAVVADGSGDVAVTGSSDNDYYTAKYRGADGGLVWEVRYNSSGGVDYPTSLAVDAGGNVVVTGASIGWRSEYDYYTAKYAGADGTLIWDKRYDGPVGGCPDAAAALAVDAEGNVVVTGSSRGSGYAPGNDNYSDIYTAKYAAADGAVLWEKRYDGPFQAVDGGKAVVIDASGNVVVAGISQTSSSAYDRYTAKYAAADGSLMWEKRNGFFSRLDVPNAVATDFNGNVVVAGVALFGGNFFAAKYEATKGTQLWEKRYGIFYEPAGPLSDIETPGCLAIGPGGAVVITGASYNGVENGYANYDYATVKYLDPITLITYLPDEGGYRVQFPSNPGNRYAVQRAPAVAGPWTTLSTVSAPPSGYVLYTDASPLPGAGFYRLLPL